MRKRPSKRISNRIHARKRAKQRFGMNLTKELESRIVKRIQAGHTEPLGKQSNTRSLHLVEVDGVTMRVAYDRSRSSLVTILPVKGEHGRPKT